MPWCRKCGYEYIPGIQLCTECQGYLEDAEADASGGDDTPTTDLVAGNLLLVSLVSIPASLLLSYFALLVSMSVGDWVGASHESLPLVGYVAYVPSILCTLVGLYVAFRAYARRPYFVFSLGILTTIIGLIQFWLVGFMILMASIG
jgi:hypothetical protein